MARPKGNKPPTKQVRLYEADQAGLNEIARDRRRTAAEAFRLVFGAKLDRALADLRAKRKGA